MCLVVTRGAMGPRLHVLSLSRQRYRLSALDALQLAYLTRDMDTHAEHTTGRPRIQSLPMPRLNILF
jgi:hypothetical protein